jgi:PAS domain S-box-containing protein
MTLPLDRLLKLFFTQSLDGFFIMMIDEPVEWGEHVDQDAVLEYVFHHQRITLANEAYASHYGLPLESLIGMTPAQFYAHDIALGKKGWRGLFDKGHVHVETDERSADGRPIRIEGHYMCAYDGDGRITGHLGIQRDITQRHRAQEELVQSREELRALAAKLETVREAERTRIAHELHDELGQALTGLKLDLAWMEQRLARLAPADAAERTRNNILGRIDLLMESVRRIVTELRPSVLDHLGLPAAIEWQSRDFASRTGLMLDLAIDAADEQKSSEIASPVFRMLQEALTNVARHANATRVSVTYRQEPHFLSLDVVDDGRGITPGELRGTNSLGLLSLRERVRACGGSIEIKGEPGRGTAVLLRVPLPAAEIRS